MIGAGGVAGQVPKSLLQDWMTLHIEGNRIDDTDVTPGGDAAAASVEGIPCDIATFENALTELLELHLIRVGPHSATITLHRRLQDVLVRGSYDNGLRVLRM